MLSADLKNMDSKKNRHSHHFEKKNTKKIFYTLQDMYNKSLWLNLIYKKNCLQRKISKEASSFQLVAVVLSLELPVRALLIIMQYSNIVTLVTRSLDESLGQSLGKIVRKSMGSDPMRD